MSLRYNRPWKPVNEKQYDVNLSALGPETSSERKRPERLTKTMANTSIYIYGRIEDGR
jgi:hypothetical protein